MKARRKKFSVNFDPYMGEDRASPSTATICLWAYDFEEARLAFLTLYPHMKRGHYAIDYWWEQEKYGSI